MRDWRIQVLPGCDALKPLLAGPLDAFPPKPPAPVAADADAPNPAPLMGDAPDGDVPKDDAPNAGVPNETPPPEDACKCAACPPAVVSGDAPA
jgi:hypothetical protein